jgi:hypothetical protein
MPFEQAVEEVRLNQHTRVEESTLRGVTYRHGVAAEAIEREKVERLEKKNEPATAKPKQLLVSVDGAFIRQTDGEWREVKTMVVGKFEPVWNAKARDVEVKTSDITYFSRSYRIREFERYAYAELHRRGLDNAQQVVTVNDGSEWITSFSDYHFPQAQRILDFRHALDHVVDAGKVIWGEGTEELRKWTTTMAHQLKHKPPQHTIADMCLLLSKTTSDEQVAAIDHQRRYLQKRNTMIDYAHFQLKGWPIGSGSVESSHKVVVHSRMKQAGMRWADPHIDPMLALRNLVCNNRWADGWQQIVDFHWQQHHHQLREKARRQRPSAPPITLACVKVAPVAQKIENLSLSATNSNDPYRPADDHPWRRGIWPTKEAWRWN